jgi:hypothetical protein
MKLTDYKTNTLARADVDDIVKIEPVELRPMADKKSYEQVVHTTELGKTIRKYDVHLMRVVDGVKQFVKEHLAVVDQGLDTEEVVFTAPTTEAKEVTETQIETYVKSLPFKDIVITKIDVAEPSALFTGIQITDGVGKRVEVFAWRDGSKAPEYVVVTQ